MTMSVLYAILSTFCARGRKGKTRRAHEKGIAKNRCEQATRLSCAVVLMLIFILSPWKSWNYSLQPPVLSHNAVYIFNTKYYLQA